MAKRNEASLLMIAAMAVVVVFLSVQVKSEVAASSYTYTAYTTEMQLAVREELRAYRYLLPGLIRLLFHDCWVNVSKDTFGTGGLSN